MDYENNEAVRAWLLKDIPSLLELYRSLTLREDIAMMFGQFHLANAQHGAALLQLNKEKGWIVKPPSYERIPETARV
ncbi:MAG: DUF3231 family protein [Bacillota bacterium]